MTQYHGSDRTSSVEGEDKALNATFATSRHDLSSSQSSLTMADQVIAENKVPNRYEYWKSRAVKEVDIRKLHEARWLPGDLVFSPTTH
jgi:hypothetical protein